ncbi:MFS transporter [Desulfosoma caldarium]|uniref:MFS transporter n=1 Tax=Desulfosoma caldarium TaxID=610254 RepID=A0A3N1VJF7_9BACT|nr:MFS transporter [Desulfosoma caldarium]ROR02933.1 MFS transporter [Desulfosoma caldarium]
MHLFRATAIRFVILLGVVSLFADATYEGARSISGPYLALLGASGTVVGFVAGFGELVGYGLRLVSGYLSDRTRRYWAMTLVGYALNLLAVPLLALAGQWELAAALLITERMGKALRTPARDAMLSYATKATGRGWGFGLHEAMDQVGAVAGPIIVTVVMARQNSYPAAFAALAIPAILALSVLLMARWLYPHPQDLEPTAPQLQAQGFPRAYWIYLAAVALVAVGYVDFPLIAYHFGKTSSVPDTWIPLLYAIAMGVDALAALLFGRWFDRIGIQILMIVSLISAFFAPLVFLGGFRLAVVGMAIWGVGMGAQESILRAAIADMVSRERRGSAYGIFNTGFGVFWFLGSALMGILYDLSLPALITFSVVMQLASVPLFFVVGKQLRK